MDKWAITVNDDKQYVLHVGYDQQYSKDTVFVVVKEFTFTGKDTVVIAKKIHRILMGHDINYPEYKIINTLQLYQQIGML